MNTKTIRYIWEDDDRTILRIDYDKGWTVQDYEIVTRETIDIIEDLSHSVYTINNFGSNIIPPAGFYKVLHRLQPLVPDNIEMVISVAHGPMLELLVRLITRLVPSIKPMAHIVFSLDEARAEITKHKQDNSADFR